LQIYEGFPSGIYFQRRIIFQRVPTSSSRPTGRIVSTMEKWVKVYKKYIYRYFRKEGGTCIGFYFEWRVNSKKIQKVESFLKYLGNQLPIFKT